MVIPIHLWLELNINISCKCFWSLIWPFFFTCGAQRMSFRDETTTGVDHKLASVRVVPSVDQLPGFTCRGCGTHKKIIKQDRVNSIKYYGAATQLMFQNVSMFQKYVDY